MAEKQIDLAKPREVKVGSLSGYSVLSPRNQAPFFGACVDEHVKSQGQQCKIGPTAPDYEHTKKNPQKGATQAAGKYPCSNADFKMSIQINGRIGSCPEIGGVAERE